MSFITILISSRFSVKSVNTSPTNFTLIFSNTYLIKWISIILICCLLRLCHRFSKKYSRLSVTSYIYFSSYSNFVVIQYLSLYGVSLHCSIGYIPFFLHSFWKARVKILIFFLLLISNYIHKINFNSLLFILWRNV